MRLYQAVPDCGASTTEHEAYDSWCRGVEYKPLPGHWEPWCVTHDAMAWGSLGAGCVNPRAGTRKCVWHPQGAFIPDEGGTTYHE